MKTYLVPFQEKETVIVGYQAKVNANTKEEAFDKISNIIADGEDPHSFTDVNANGIEYDIEAHANLGIIEHIDSTYEYKMDDYSADDVEEDDDRVCCELELTAFDIARYGQDELYKMVEEKFRQVGLNYEILEMDMIPTKIEEHFVTYDCIPINFNRTWSHGDISIHRNNEMITPLHESLLLFNEKVMSISCDYNRETAIKLPQSFDISSIDAKMRSLKTDVATFRDINYIVGVMDSGYALWECEV